MAARRPRPSLAAWLLAAAGAMPKARRLETILSHMSAAAGDTNVEVAVDAATPYEQADAHLIQPYDMLDNPTPTRFLQVGGEGIYLITDKGEKIIDGAGGMWNVNIGYGNKKLADAIGKQALQMAYNSPWHNTSTPAAKLSAKIASLAADAGLPDMKHVFFTTGGSTAVDSALQFVFYRSNFLGKPGKKMILCRENAYHGSTYLSHSVTFDGPNVESEKRLIKRLMDPNPLNPARAEGSTMQDWEDALVAELQSTITDLGPDNIGAMIAEPIMGAGGVIVAPPNYLRRCQQLCNANDIAYISDEVVTAFGRLGHFFASNLVFDLQPDIICFAKGVTSGYQPLGGILISDRLLKGLIGVQGAKFMTGFTYSGHPVACAAALTNIEIMEDLNICAHVADVGPYFQERLKTELESLPLVLCTRGMGLMAAIVYTWSDDDQPATEQKGEELADLTLAKGSLVRMLGSGNCILSPPLIITKPEIDTLVSHLKEATVEYIAAHGVD